MSSHPWNRLPDPCLLTIFKHFTLIELFRTIRLVCSRWSHMASSELSQRHTLVIASWCLFPPYNILPLNPSALLKHLRDNGGQSLKVKYLKPIDDRAIVNLDYGEKNVFQGQFVTVMLNNLPNITNLTLWFYYVHKRENPSKCEFTQLIRILSHWKNSLLDLSLYLSYDYKDEQSESNVETLYKSINQHESLKHLKLDLKIRRCDDSQFIPTPKLTILSQLKTFTFSSWYDDNVQAALLNQLEKDCSSCKIGCEVRYSTLRKNGHFELDQIARLDPKFAAKFVNFRIYGEVGLECLENLQLICSKFTSLRMLDLFMDGTILMSMLAQGLSQLPKLIHLRLKIARYNIPKEDTPVNDIAQSSSVRLLTLYIKTRSHFETGRLYLAQIFPKLQVLQLWHSGRYCHDCDFDYHKTRKYHFCDGNFGYTQERLDGVISPEEQIRIAQCMHKAKKPFRACVQLHTVEFNDGPFRMLNRKLVSREQYFAEPVEISHET